MPELPEVETIRRQLHEQLAGAVIHQVTIFRSGRERPLGKEFVQALTGKTIRSVERRAKLLVWRFTDDTALIAHLKMTGSFVFVDREYSPGKHDRVLFECRSGAEDLLLVWSDIRQFGFTHVVSDAALATIFEAYGPEPLETPVEKLSDCLRSSSRRPVKSFLLDQTVLAGVGNIYADESLHRAGIRPTRRVGSLSARDRRTLAEKVKEVLSESLAQQGTSANDYIDTRGERGGFLEFLRVYGRTGKPCLHCESSIKRIVVGQRGTHYCPECQK